MKNIVLSLSILIPGAVIANSSSSETKTALTDFQTQIEGLQEKLSYPHHPDISSLKIQLEYLQSDISDIVDELETEIDRKALIQSWQQYVGQLEQSFNRLSDQVSADKLSFRKEWENWTESFSDSLNQLSEDIKAVKSIENEEKQNKKLKDIQDRAVRLTKELNYYESSAAAESPELAERLNRDVQEARVEVLQHLERRQKALEEKSELEEFASEAGDEASAAYKNLKEQMNAWGEDLNQQKREFQNSEEWQNFRSSASNTWNDVKESYRELSDNIQNSDAYQEGKDAVNKVGESLKDLGDDLGL